MNSLYIWMNVANFLRIDSSQSDLVGGSCRQKRIITQLGTPPFGRRREPTNSFFPKKQRDSKYFHVMQNFPTYSGKRLARNLFGVWWSGESVQCTLWLNKEITNMKKSSIYEWSGPRNGQRVLSEPNHCFCVQWGALSIAHCQQSVDKWKIIRPARLDDPHTKMTCCCCRVQLTL